MSSAASDKDIFVEREAVVALAPRRPAPTAVAPEPAPAPPVSAPVAAPPPRADSAFIGVLAALATLLAARLLLLLSIAGAFVLALLAVRAESNGALAVLVAFCLLTVIPVVVLDVITHRRGGK